MLVRTFRWMTVRRWAKRLIERDRVVRAAMRKLLLRSWSRHVLNVIYLGLPSPFKGAFYLWFAKLFRNYSSSGSSGNWKVDFLGKTILLPLSPESFGLEWDCAVSLLGHDTEITETYRALIRSSTPPELFVDIGANYGLHSLLFLTNGVDTITIEPNLSCHPYFERVCHINKLAPCLERVAIGEKVGQVELTYPPLATWLGSTDYEVSREFSGSPGVIVTKVPQKTADEYFSRIVGRRTLIKIDTEGNELCVLRGAERILREARPKIVFEVFQTWDGQRRKELFEFLEFRNYGVFNLPWRPGGAAQLLEIQQFMTSRFANFIAIPDVPLGSLIPKT